MQNKNQLTKPDKIATLVVVIGIILILGIVVLGSKNKNSTPTNEITVNTNNTEISTVATPLNDSIILFFGITCPHCEDVEDWIEQNSIDEKITIERKEVYQNTTNARELTKVAEGCGINTNSVGVPFLYAEGNCYVGTPDIVSYISNKVNASEKEVSQ